MKVSYIGWWQRSFDYGHVEAWQMKIRNNIQLFLLFTPQSCFGLDFFEDLDWVSWSYLSSFLTMFEECTATLRNPREKQVIRSENKHGSTPSLTSRERFVYILHLIKTSHHFPGHANLSKFKKAAKVCLAKIKEAMLMDSTYFEPNSCPQSTSQFPQQKINFDT